MDTQVRINYDTAFGEDDEMSQTDLHNDLIIYLMLLLRQLFANRNTAIFTSIDLYGDPTHPGQKKSPDILVIDNVTKDPDQAIISYTIDEEHIAPRVLMEINSHGNWINDVEEKHDVYERMRVPEYFVCDPQPERVWTGIWQNEPRLIGWRYNSLINGYVRIPQEPQGLWSEQLESYLIMEGASGRELHLYDREGNLRLTGEEAERVSRRNDQIRAQQEKEQLQKQLDDESQRANDESQRANDESQRAEKLAAYLRQLGINPDDIK